MDVNHILLWNVGVLAVLIALASFRDRAAYGLVAGGALLLAVVVGWLLWPDLAGFVAGGVSVLLLLPNICAWLVSRLLDRGQFRVARVVAAVPAWLRLPGQWRVPSVFLRALELAQRGAVDDAERLLIGLGEACPALARDAEAKILQLRGDWEGLIRLGETMGAHGVAVAVSAPVPRRPTGLHARGSRPAPGPRRLSASRSLRPSLIRADEIIK